MLWRSRLLRRLVLALTDFLRSNRHSHDVIDRVGKRWPNQWFLFICKNLNAKKFIVVTDIVVLQYHADRTQ